MNDGVRLPEIASTRFLKMKGNVKNHQPRSLCEKGEVSNRTKNPTSLYTLHCFFKLASQELTPCYRKQAAVRQAEIDLNKHREKVENKNRAVVTGQDKHAVTKRKVHSNQNFKQQGRESASMLESTSLKSKNTTKNNNSSKKKNYKDVK